MSCSQQEKGCYSVSAAFAKQAKDRITSYLTGTYADLFSAAKMTQAFVNGMPKKERDQLIVGTLIEGAHGFRAAQDVYDTLSVFFSVANQSSRAVSLDLLKTLGKSYGLRCRELNQHLTKERNLAEKNRRPQNPIDVDDFDMGLYVSRALGLSQEVYFRGQLQRNHPIDPDHMECVFPRKHISLVIKDLVSGNGRLNSPKVSTFDAFKIKRGEKLVAFGYESLQFFVDLDQKSIEYTIYEGNHSVDRAYDNCALFSELLCLMEQAGPRNCKGSAKYTDEYIQEDFGHPHARNVFGMTEADIDEFS